VLQWHMETFTDKVQGPSHMIDITNVHMPGPAEPIDPMPASRAVTDAYTCISPWLTCRNASYYHNSETSRLFLTLQLLPSTRLPARSTFTQHHNNYI